MKKSNYIIGLLIDGLLIIVSVFYWYSAYNSYDAVVFSAPFELLRIFINLIITLMVFLSFVILLIKKKQSGLGVALPMILASFSSIVGGISRWGIIPYMIQIPDWDGIIPIIYNVLLIATSIMIVVLYRKPNRMMQVATILMCIFIVVSECIYLHWSLWFELGFRGALVLVIFILMIFQIALLFSCEDKKKIKENDSLNKTPITLNNGVAESLKQYKELLDDGVITQEEFDKKKKELL